MVLLSKDGPYPAILPQSLEKVQKPLEINNNRTSGIVLSIFLIVIILGFMLFAGCVSGRNEMAVNEHVASSSDQLWTPPAGTGSQPNAVETRIEIPDELLKPGVEWRLSDIIEIALQNNPDTRAAWHFARSAAADLVNQKGNYYPQINGSASVSHNLSSGGASQPGSSSNSTTSVVSFNPALQLSWLIFDMGGRDAAVDEKYQALLAADFTHNASIQDAVFQVIGAYFQYANAKAVKKAYEISVKDATENLEAAKQRHDNGLATIADVLQFKTALSQAQVNLDTADGLVQTIRGALATAMGLPANTPYEIEDLPLNPKVESISESVDAYIQQAEANRPDLAAQKSRVEQSMAHMRTTRSALYPSLSFSDTLGGGIDSQGSKWSNQNIAMLKLSIPIYSGRSLQAQELKAREDAEAQKANLKKLEQTIIYQVWSSYFGLKTSAQRVKSNDDLIASAQQSFEVAQGRYKAGVGGYLDLLAAQGALENARAQRVTALADWYVSLAQLARDAGVLWRQPGGEQAHLLDIFPNATIKDQKP
jgi:outer membrane protein